MRRPHLVDGPGEAFKLGKDPHPRIQGKQHFSAR
ncbi:hypothetical protein CEXT_354641, partial [Caerostris extrusa]